MAITCETSESTSNTFVGIVLVLLACFCYAFGNCLQRYSLLKLPGEKVFGILNRNLGWLLGAIIYFSANGLYAIALSFAPVTVLAAVFSLTILANACCAVFFLGDRIPLLAYPGYACVLLGSILFSVTIRAEVCHFDGDELTTIMSSPTAISFWTVTLIIMIGGAIFARHFERAHPLSTTATAASLLDDTELDTTNDDDNANSYQPADQVTQQQLQQQKVVGGGREPLQISEPQYNPAAAAGVVVVEDHVQPRALLIARTLYPAALGTTEAVGALILKAVNSLLTTSIVTTSDAVDADDYFPDEPNTYIGLWIVFLGMGVILFLGIVIWLRLVYSRFEITGAFPVEFGVLTFLSVIGGFMVFQDYKFVTNGTEWFLVSLAGISILGGIMIVGFVSWQATLKDEEEKEAEEKLHPESANHHHTENADV